MFLFQGFCLIVFARQSRIFTAQALSSRAPLSQQLFYVLFIQAFLLKKKKKKNKKKRKRNLSTQSELFAKLVSFPCLSC